MALPLQPSQRSPNVPPNQIPMSSGPFMREPRRLEGDFRNRMQPPGAIPGVPKRNMIQTMLGKFLPKRGAQQTATLPAQAVNDTNTTGGGITSTLSNVQQVLNIVQQTAPIVKEYGPMVKNIPTMLRMVKAFNNLDDDEPESNTEEKQAQQSEQSTEETQKAESKNVQKTAWQTSIQTEEHNPIQNGESKPLLFI